jgi:hypothetical protein
MARTIFDISNLRRIRNGIVDAATITKQGIQDIRKGEGYLGEKVRAVTDKVSDKIDKTKTILDTFGEQAAKIEKVPAFYKIIFLMFFYIFFYKIFYDIGVFFGLNNLEMIIYMTWFGMILFFASFISAKRSRLK